FPSVHAPLSRRLRIDWSDRDPGEPQLPDAAGIERKAIAVAIVRARELQSSDRKNARESVTADGLRIDVAPRIVNLQHIIANKDVILDTELSAVELALVGLEPLRRRPGDHYASHRKACAVLVEDGVLTLSAFRWIVKDDFCWNHSEAEGGVGDC